MMKLEGKTILITGAAKRLGHHLALYFAQKGATIAAHYRTPPKDGLKQNEQITYFQADLTSILAIKKLADHVNQTLGKVDVLINNASVFYETPFEKITEQNWEEILNTNLKAPLFLSQQLTQKSKKLKIINITDSGGPRTRANYIPYWLSKSALKSMTETMAKALMPHVQVNAIAPGPIGFEEDLERFKNDITVSPNDLAQACEYLISASQAVTGNTLIVDGGRRYT